MNSNSVIEEFRILRIIQEDILRILGERKNKTTLRFIKSRIRVPSSYKSRAIKRLEKEGLISIDKDYIRLTENGLNIAKTMVEKHLFLERYLKNKRSKREAHISAHLLEHYISEEVINNIKKILTLKKQGVPLTNFGLNKDGLITDILSSDYKLFERMISMGILPGVMIEATYNIPNAIVVKINNKKIVLDKTIAKRIKVLEYEKS